MLGRCLKRKAYGAHTQLLKRKAVASPELASLVGKSRGGRRGEIEGDLGPPEGGWLSLRKRVGAVEHFSYFTGASIRFTTPKLILSTFPSLYSKYKIHSSVRVHAPALRAKT